MIITAMLFTAVGWKLGREHIVQTTIDSLIADGYLKTRGSGEEEELVLWRYWDSK